MDSLVDIGEYFWLFVLGVNNSGTTVLSRVLETHPLIRALPAEGQLLTDAFPRPDKLGVTRIWSSRLDVFRWTEDSDPDPALRAKMDWLGFYPRRSGILLEKSPPDSVRARWLQCHFRPARFMAIIRSPYAVCEGIRRREGYGIEVAARHWVVANECMLADLEHLDHCLHFKYEDLAARPEEHLSMIQSFLELGIPFDSEMVRKVKAHSSEGELVGIQDLNSESIARLSSQDIALINDIAGPLMKHLDYALL